TLTFEVPPRTGRTLAPGAGPGFSLLSTGARATPRVSGMTKSGGTGIVPIAAVSGGEASRSSTVVGVPSAESSPPPLHAASTPAIRPPHTRPTRARRRTRLVEVDVVGSMRREAPGAHAGVVARFVR